MTIRETERYELYFCPFGKAYRVCDMYTGSVSNLLTDLDTWEEANRAADLPEDAFEHFCEVQLGYSEELIAA